MGLARIVSYRGGELRRPTGLMIRRCCGMCLSRTAPVGRDNDDDPYASDCSGSLSSSEEEDDPLYQQALLLRRMATRFLWSDGDDRLFLPTRPCPQACRPVQCPNAAVCGSFEEPEWVLRCHNGLCAPCDMSQFELRGLDVHGGRVECPVCLSERHGAVRLYCMHGVCVECFIVMMKTAIFGARPAGWREVDFKCPLCRAPSF